MRVDVTHSLGVGQASARLDGFLDSLTASRFPGGLAITSPRKAWDDNRLGFSFDAAASGIRVTIEGTIHVSADKVTVESDLPLLVRTFIGEERVAAIVAEGLEGALA